MRKLIKGINDLASQFPKIVFEWSDKNTPLHSDMIFAASHKKVWWKGACVHDWRAKILDRTIDRKCCRVCEDEFEKLLTVLTVLYYTGKQETKIILNETQTIGLPLDIYLPEQKTAIIISARKLYSDEGM